MLIEVNKRILHFGYKYYERNVSSIKQYKMDKMPNPAYVIYNRTSIKVEI